MNFRTPTSDKAFVMFYGQVLLNIIALRDLIVLYLHVLSRGAVQY